MANPKRIYVRQRLDKWGTFKIPTTNGIQVPLSGDGISSVGCLLAYSSKRAFKKQHPGEQPLTFRLERAA